MANGTFANPQRWTKISSRLPPGLSGERRKMHNCCIAASQVTLCLSKSRIRAPTIGIPPHEKGPFSAFFLGKSSRSADPPRSKTRKNQKTTARPTLMAHKALKAHTSTQRAHRALKAHTSTQRAHRALKAHTSTQTLAMQLRTPKHPGAAMGARFAALCSQSLIRLRGKGLIIPLLRRRAGE